MATYLDSLALAIVLIACGHAIGKIARYALRPLEDCEINNNDGEIYTPTERQRLYHSNHEDLLKVRE